MLQTLKADHCGQGLVGKIMSKYGNQISMDPVTSPLFGVYCKGYVTFFIATSVLCQKQVMHQVQTIILNLDIHCTFAKIQGIDDILF